MFTGVWLRRAPTRHSSMGVVMCIGPCRGGVDTCFVRVSYGLQVRSGAARRAIVIGDFGCVWRLGVVGEGRRGQGREA